MITLNPKSFRFGWPGLGWTLAARNVGANDERGGAWKDPIDSPPDKRGAYIPTDDALNPKP